MDVHKALVDARTRNGRKMPPNLVKGLKPDPVDVKVLLTDEGCDLVGVGILFRLEPPPTSNELKRAIVELLSEHYMPLVNTACWSHQM